ncbi:MAG: sigma-54-dependent Fis family transcriptional regulator [Myxococcales bacterium]|nr:sigma-54-dependent Fis family transcriptional regulator [Myxococcales bacterium]
MGRVLIVDDEPGIRAAVEALVFGLGHEVAVAARLDEALARLEEQPFDVVITDLRLSPSEDGMDVVRRARSGSAPSEVIVMTAYGTREKAQAAIALGASFYLEKGPHLATDLAVLVKQAVSKRQLEAENEGLRRELLGHRESLGLVGRSPAMKEVLDVIERVGPLKVTVLLTGESGTGKERVARALHHLGATPGAPFVPVNCGAIPEALIESELFGHVEGAFTGASQAKEGLFQAARGGTIFLDEVGELSTPLQVKLLRVLQERMVKPVGATREIEVDVRVVAATNRDLEAEAEAGRFREDLYFRLNVVQVDLPPLRQRTEDIPMLAQAFLRRYATEYGRPVTTVEAAAMAKLLEFPYPGNIRQLQNIIERAVALSRGQEIRLDDLPRDVRASLSVPDRVIAVNDDFDFPPQGVDLERLLRDFELRWIEKALECAGGVKTKAAELLGMSFRQFRYKLSKVETNR